MDHPDRSQLFLVYGDAAKGTYGPLIDSEDTVATTLKGAAAAVENAEWFAYDALRDGFEANLVETLDAFNAGATSTCPKLAANGCALSKICEIKNET